MVLRRWACLCLCRLSALFLRDIYKNKKILQWLQTPLVAMKEVAYFQCVSVSFPCYTLVCRVSSSSPNQRNRSLSTIQRGSVCSFTRTVLFSLMSLPQRELLFHCITASSQASSSPVAPRPLSLPLSAKTAACKALNLLRTFDLLP